MFCNISVVHANLPEYEGESKVLQYFGSTC